VPLRVSSLPRTALLFIAGIAVAASGVAQTAPDSRTIDRIARAAADSGFSGVILVAHGNTITLLRAYGKSISSTDDPFWIGSMTKGFTAAAILRLMEQNRFTLNDSVGRFFPDAPTDKKGITLHQLLTHTAGFVTSYTGGGLIARDEAVRAILSRPLGYPPGQGYRYVDDDYELLAAIVEAASGLSWEDYLQLEILRPAGLSRTGFWCGRNIRTSLPGPVTTRRACASSRTATPPADWGHRGANGMSSTAQDLFRWTRAIRDGKVLKAADGALLLSRQVFVREEPPDSVYYGYGVRLYARRGNIVEIMHSGSSDAGNTAIVRVLSSRTTIIVLSDSGMHDRTTWSSSVAQQLAVRQ
jgi:CubicO group peptidase (beta-lactamase class C family)